MGRIMFVSSQAGQIGLFGYTAYSPSKFALRGLAESLQMEVGSGTAVPCNNMSTKAVIHFYGKTLEVTRGIDHMYSGSSLKATGFVSYVFYNAAGSHC